VSSRLKNSAYVIAVLVGASAALLAQTMAPDVAPPANVRPPGLKNVGVVQRLDQQLPLDLVLRDETGKAVHLGDYFGKEPVVVSFVYYRCPMLCPELLMGLESALRVLRFNVGDQFQVITVSFDPNDTPALAAAKKATILSRYKRPGAADGWHFLTGSQESISRLTQAAGFGYQYDASTGQFAHATAIMVATPTGKLAQYYYGVDFPPRDLELALVQASKNRIGNLADAVILYCFHYDPTQGRYSLIISRIIKLSGVLTILSIGTVLVVLFRRGPDYRRVPRDQSSHQHVQ
jgi:protein SCO1